MDPSLTSRLSKITSGSASSSSSSLSLYEAQSLVSEHRHNPFTLFQVAEIIRASGIHKAHTKLAYIQPPVLYRACFLMAPTYAEPVLALARGILSEDFFEAERMLTGIFDVPTLDPATTKPRFDPITSIEAFAPLAPQYPLSIKSFTGERYHRLHMDGVKRNMAMAERVLEIFEAIMEGKDEVYLAARSRLTPLHIKAAIEACRVLARCHVSLGPINTIVDSYTSYLRGYEITRRFPSLISPKDKVDLAENMALIRYYFAHRAHLLPQSATYRGSHGLPHSSHDWANIVNEAYRGARIVPRGVAASSSVGVKKPGVLRIGYVSPDLRSTAVGWFITALLRHFDPSRFEVYVYNTHRGDLTRDPARIFFRTSPVNWYDLDRFTDETAEHVLRAHNLDVLVDLLCYHRAVLLASRPAPRILTYLGYPGKTYLECVDGRVVDHVSDPVIEIEAGEPGEAQPKPGEAQPKPGEAQPNPPSSGEPKSSSANGFISERDPRDPGEPLIRLPNCFLCFTPLECYAPNPIVSVESSRQFTLPGKGGEGVSPGVIFGVFNKSVKFSPEVVAAWKRIMAERQDAVMVFKRDERYMDPQLWEAFRDQFGAAKPRIQSFPFTDDVREYLDYYNAVDVTLDTWPYSGTTTTCSSLYMGVPVLTVGGSEHVERVTQSILQHANLSQWVVSDAAAQDPTQPAPSFENYVATAVRWDRDEATPDLAARETIRSRFLASMEIAPFMRNWEAMLEEQAAIGKGMVQTEMAVSEGEAAES